MIGNRIKKRREELKLTQEELGKLIGIGKTAVSNYEQNISSPKASVITLLFSALKCDANYLFADYILRNNFQFTESENKHIEKYRFLDSFGKSAIDGLLEAEHFRCLTQGTNSDVSNSDKENGNTFQLLNSTEASKLSLKNNLIIPFFNYTVSVSIGENFITDAEQFIRIPQVYRELHADYAVRISDSSMEPDYADGDILLIRYQQQLDIGDLGIFIANNKMYFRELGYGRLLSLNPEFDDLIINADFNPIIQGKVISKLEK